MIHIQSPTLKRECLRRMQFCHGKEKQLYSLALDRIEMIEMETAVVDGKPVKAEIDDCQFFTHPHHDRIYVSLDHFVFQIYTYSVFNSQAEFS